jgi:deoxyadenosine/deoxycytidine kinase
MEETIRYPTMLLPDQDSLLKTIDMSLYCKKRNQITIISIEGNIGAGKSTLIANLKAECPDFEFIAEPSDKWESTVLSNGKNMLKEFYDDMKLRAAAFQMYAITTRLERLIETIMKTDKKIIVMERSPYTDKNCFFELQRESGNIDEYNGMIYLSLFALFEKVLSFEPEKVIYLEIDPPSCKSRIIERGRSSEKGIPMGYLNQLEEKHKKWISNYPEKVHTINALENFKTDINVIRKIANYIRAISKCQ